MIPFFQAFLQNDVYITKKEMEKLKKTQPPFLQEERGDRRETQNTQTEKKNPLQALQYKHFPKNKQEKKRVTRKRKNLFNAREIELKAIVDPCQNFIPTDKVSTVHHSNIGSHSRKAVSRKPKS